MTINPDELYVGREASLIKHLILRSYLEKLAYKVGTWCNTINYVDGFAGPWQSVDQALSDTSPHVALNQLAKVGEGLQNIGRTPRMRCLFVESDVGAANRLRASIQSGTDAEIIQGRFLDVIPEILDFIRSPDGRDPRFTFLFVDPTGWTGYDPTAIARLLRAKNTEVMINFMTKDIIRFIDSRDERTRQSFMPLFDSQEDWDGWRHLTGREREDAIVQAFCWRVQKIGNFKDVVSAIVLNPVADRTHFHLIYATRSIEGLRTFREVEGAALGEQTKVRAAALHKKQTAGTGQASLFQVNEVEVRGYADELATAYRGIARSEIRRLLEARSPITFDELELQSLQHPMTSTHQLKSWLGQWKNNGLVRYEGLGTHERSLKPEKGHQIIWIGNRKS